ncbi:MAG: protocatechuate 3,4-dioxygenase subunit alpha [Pseudomonadota bacterium]
MGARDTDLKETPSQTAGPFVHIGLTPRAAGFEADVAELGQDIAGPHAAGERIRVEGTVLDGEGALVRDMMIEIWQANADGHYAHPSGGGPVDIGFRGWGRAATDFESGLWSVSTVKPGAVQGMDGHAHAPHLSLWLVARGINIGLHTRLYFSDETAANAADPVLACIAPAERRATLIATRSDPSDRCGLPVYRFDIQLQGADETVFFDV